ncbi:serine--tRNA ligase [Candidatus Peribacteria bacterium RIFCSPLOWO2_12_FULL_55_15]|nr:MAG: serine--tRNA ligase [Candidatus Peribacteria bacterium RIFCSPHIGHO2_01_FULL_54_22]OGJ62378.1 MAG: serine--tRNA ligase [Candidatus Peribacteria bacterium RIFCSPHIGHO2_02_FULL_55_24]OGJ65241.1 MAG: serine--tRNA ligase [Candidatus Peribacteria bacterium RIFCSPHIGHO2_12_FULL_54_10]OGJ68523.1 MAG: serine--tRNA ligase [Candidatus Peribacteria bacterium RIFCSPLOWO2_01_FULL_54_110]OGJ69094.1 MAG: serine--tRNA ligase [Candidatus Peribacteria bacterium RIFCSPLOWO2_02_FULL_55_36]OGJ72168.1 MAG: s
MIDLDDLRRRPDIYKKAVKDKGIDVSVDGFLKLDILRQEALQRTEEDRAKKNSVSKRIPVMKGKEKETALAEMKALSGNLKTREDELQTIENSWLEMQLLLPSLPLDRVPRGKDENGNREVKKWGDPSTTLRVTPAQLKDHVAIGEALDIIDIPRGVKVAGARSYFLKGDGARLELALLQFTIDHLLKKKWTLFAPPLMATRECLVGTGFFPGAEEQMYVVDKDRYLIGTSEVSVCSYHKDEVLDVAELPKRYCGFSTCFRREAGTYGKDTKGLYRVHQFQKVEQVVLCEADEEKAMVLFEEIRTNAEEVLHALELPYRVMDICTGEMGRGKVFMQDIETWMPSRNAYGETHSCSYLGDFQARRLNIKYIAENGEKKFVHTLNNTCIASPRILIPLLEIYQNKDGTMTIPKVLRPYMGGQERMIPVSS